MFPQSAIREFLRENPEFIPDVRPADFGEGAEPAMTSACTAAFVRWAVRTGRCCDGARAEAVLAAMREMFPDADWGDAP